MFYLQCIAVYTTNFEKFMWCHYNIFKVTFQWLMKEGCQEVYQEKIRQWHISLLTHSLKYETLVKMLFYSRRIWYLDINSSLLEKHVWFNSIQNSSFTFKFVLVSEEVGWILKYSFSNYTFKIMEVIKKEKEIQNMESLQSYSEHVILSHSFSCFDFETF